MRTLIQAKILNSVEALGRQFRSNDPFPHVVLDNFVEPDFLRQLQDEFPAFDPAHALNEMGEVGGKAFRPDMPRLGPAYCRFDAMLRSPEFLHFVSGLTGIPKLLYDREYVGGGTHENLEGQDLTPHVDFNFHPRTNRHRRLNLILFLNPEWEESWGGSLELHLNPWLPAGQNRVKSVLPIENRGVLFETSERSWHGFPAIRFPEGRKGLSRRSIAVYFYTKERPAEETKPSHGTIYVPQPLPDHLQPGYTLQDKDVVELRNLVQRRDTQIQFLYERELKFSETLTKVLGSPVYRLAAAVTWPLRAIKRKLTEMR